MPFTPCKSALAAHFERVRPPLKQGANANLKHVETMIEDKSEVSSESQNVKRGNGFINIEGEVFGRLKVISFAGKNKSKQAQWNCLCECTNTAVVAGSKLRRGHTRSCGCLQKEVTGTRATIHGWTKHPLYRVYLSMIARCENPNSTCAHNYGGRGIKVCDRWKNSFADFLADMGERPAAGYSIERNDNNGNYEPGNCRWATSGEQGSNRRNNHLIAFDGRTQTLTQWAAEKGLKTHALLARITRHGWSIEMALNTPPQRKRRGVFTPPLNTQNR